MQEACPPSFARASGPRKKKSHLAEQPLNQSEVEIPALIQIFINLSSAFLWKEWID